jgi:hypothetical protein
MDTLYTRLFWMTCGGCGWVAHPELRPDLDRFGVFFVDYAWAIPNQGAPTARLVGATDALLRLEAARMGWGLQPARGHLADALEELRVWAESLRSSRGSPA